MAADIAYLCSMLTSRMNAAALQVQTRFSNVISHLYRSQVTVEPWTHPGVA